MSSTHTLHPKFQISSTNPIYPSPPLSPSIQIAQKFFKSLRERVRYNHPSNHTLPKKILPILPNVQIAQILKFHPKLPEFQPLTNSKTLVNPAYSTINIELTSFLHFNKEITHQISSKITLLASIKP